MSAPRRRTGGVDRPSAHGLRGGDREGLELSWSCTTRRTTPPMSTLTDVFPARAPAATRFSIPAEDGVAPVVVDLVVDRTVPGKRAMASYSCHVGALVGARLGELDVVGHAPGARAAKAVDGAGVPAAVDRPLAHAGDALGVDVDDDDPGAGCAPAQLEARVLRPGPRGGSRTPVR
jgi:hypothetical protein